MTDWAVLGVVAEGTTHGFAVARELAADGPVGRIWAVHRPLVYRSLAHLAATGLVEEVGPAPGAGPPRTLVRATPPGRRRLRRWLHRPVEHVRDLRSELLLKLVLLDRAGLPAAALVEAQRPVVREIKRGLETQLRAARGFDAVVARWRLEAAVAAERFLERLQ